MLIWLAATAVVLLVLGLLGVTSTLARTLLAVPLVLILPGYALIAALFPARSLGLAERVLSSLGLSLVVAIAGGLILNVTPWGLRPLSWLLFLAATSLIGIVLALLRRREQWTLMPFRWSDWLLPRQAILIGAALLITGGSIAIARFGASRQHASGFTQLWMLPADQTGQNTIQLGFSSMEIAATRYRVELRAGDTIMREWPSQELAPGQSWETTFTLPANAPVDVPLEAVLYRLGVDETAYRRVRLAPVELGPPE